MIQLDFPNRKKIRLCLLVLLPGPALADAGPNPRPKRGAPLSSDFMTSSCSVNRVTIVVERKYAVQGVSQLLKQNDWAQIQYFK